MSRPKQQCSVDGCDKWRVGRGYCDLHYRRYVKHGDPLVVLRSPKPECCTVEGCHARVSGRGLCAKHYTRWIKYGDVYEVRDNRGPRARRPMLDRFLEKVAIEGDCWVWNTGAKGRRGYPSIGTPSGHNISAHRYAAMLRYGMFDQRLLVRHDCDNKRCVNPAHMSLGTHADNMRDYVERGLPYRKCKEFCKRGHSLADAYVYNGRRSCRPCRAIADRARKAARP